MPEVIRFGNTVRVIADDGPASTVPGPPGPAGNVAVDLAGLKAAPTTNLTMLYDDVTFNWTLGNYTGLADDYNVVQADGVPLTTGAWVRQEADKVRFGDSNVGSQLSDAPTSAHNLTMAPRPVMLPNQAVYNAITASSLTITVVGDSIMEPAGIAYADSVAENMQRMMQSTFPWMTVNLTNRSIPGRAMSQLANSGYVAPGNFTLAAGGGSGELNTSYWPGGSVNGKSWRDHVKDDAPDIIVLALGENDGDDVLPFLSNYQTFYEYTQTWTKKPWFVLLASLIPEGDDATRTGKQAIADFMKYKAIEQGFGLIDANSFYRLLRDGERRDLVPFIQEDDFLYWGDASKWGVSGSLNKVGTTVSGAGLAQRGVAARDIDLTTDFTLDGDDAILLVNFRNRPAEAGFSYQADFAGGFGRLYYRAILQAAPAIPVVGDGDTVNVRVSAKGPLIQVWHDRVLVLSVSRSFGMESGPLAIGTAQGAGAFDNFAVAYAEEYQAAASFYSAGYLLNDLLHHPTADGAFQVYIPATKQFVDEFAREVSAIRRGSKVATSGIAAGTATNVSGAQAIIADMAVTFTLARAATVLVSITLQYQNPDVTNGRLLTALDGEYQFGGSVWLLPTTGTEVNLVHVMPMALSAGEHTVYSAWDLAAGLSSPANGRSISVIIPG